MSPDSQTSVRIKIVFGDGIAFVCFYNAKRVLSAVAKLFSSLGNGRGDGMGEGEVGEESREGSGRVGKRCERVIGSMMAGNRNVRKQPTQHIWHDGDAPQRHPPVEHHVFLRNVRFLLRFRNSDNLICSLLVNNASPLRGE